MLRLGPERLAEDAAVQKAVSSAAAPVSDHRSASRFPIRNTRKVPRPSEGARQPRALDATWAPWPPDLQGGQPGPKCVTQFSPPHQRHVWSVQESKRSRGLRRLTPRVYTHGETGQPCGGEDPSH